MGIGPEWVFLYGRTLQPVDAENQTAREHSVISLG